MILPGLLTRRPLATRGMARGYTEGVNQGNARVEESKRRSCLGLGVWGAACCAPTQFVMTEGTCEVNCLGGDYWGHWVWRADSMSGSRRAPRHLAVQSCVEVRPLAPRRSAPDKVALRMSASRRTAPVRNAPCRSEPWRSALSRMVPFICAPLSLACAIFAEDRSVCVRFAKERID